MNEEKFCGKSVIISTATKLAACIALATIYFWEAIVAVVTKLYVILTSKLF